MSEDGMNVVVLFSKDLRLFVFQVNPYLDRKWPTQTISDITHGYKSLQMPRRR